MKEAKLNAFDWVEFYKELAWKLREYKNNRPELIAKVIQIFSDTGLNMPTIEKDNQLVDIDPFTIYGLFNKGIREENRKKAINSIKNVFRISAPVPSNFESIPVLNNQNATFYRFIGERDDEDINILWKLFDTALAYTVSHSTNTQNDFSNAFEHAIQMKGNAIAKITMGLYWIAPDTFLNLDSRNRWYLYESGKLPLSFVKTLPIIKNNALNASTYLEIIAKMRSYLNNNSSEMHSFMELSSEAWRYSERVNIENNQLKQEDKSVNNALPFLNNKDSLGQTKPEMNRTAMPDADVQTTHYWLYSPGENAKYWEECYENGIMMIRWDGIGDLKQYTSKDKMIQAMKRNIDPDLPFTQAAYMTWHFSNVMRPGDVVFVKKGRRTVVGRGIVISEYEFDEAQAYHKNIRKVRWTHKGEWTYPGIAPLKTLTDITNYTDCVEKLNSLFEGDDAEDLEEVANEYPSYDKRNFLDDVYMSEREYQTLKGLILNKQNVILSGPPGVGKTFAAKRLAYAIMGVKDPARVQMIQFHQSYSYEDFIMGFRPSENGFELKYGPFYEFCKKAEIDSDNDYFFIIDEINRGNLSRIFGELFMLIENDKRGYKLRLLYGDEEFSVPPNVYIIGMMNTADRSLAMLDYALRRRFAFYDMKPGFDANGFRSYQSRLDSQKFDRLIHCIKDLNETIVNDDSLGEGFRIGHSYFCALNEVNDQALASIVEYEIIPLLKEYWFDDRAKAKTWSDNLRRAIL